MPGTASPESGLRAVPEQLAHGCDLDTNNRVPHYVVRSSVSGVERWLALRLSQAPCTGFDVPHEAIVAALTHSQDIVNVMDTSVFGDVNLAGPGLLNLRLSPRWVWERLYSYTTAKGASH